MKTILFLPVLCLFTAMVAAQAPKGSAPIASPAVAPPGPLLRPVPDFSQWQITFTYLSDRKPKDRPSSISDPAMAARARKTVTTKTGRIVHEQQTDMGGRMTDLWFDGPTQFYKTAVDSLWFQLSPEGTQNKGSAGTYCALPASGYRELDWINESTYAGTIPYGPRNCLVFCPGGARSLDLTDPEQRQNKLESERIVAYVDADTRMPIAVRAGDIVRTFVFDPPPTEMQKFPVELADQIRKGKEGQTRLEIPAGRPY